MKDLFRVVAVTTYIGDTGVDCLDCKWKWQGEAPFSTAQAAARSHTKNTGHTTHWSDQRSGGFKADKS